MIRLLAVVVFLAHLVLIRKGGTLRWLMLGVIGAPAALMVATYFMIGSEENRDLLYILPIWAMIPLAAAELVAGAMALKDRLSDQKR